MKSFRSSLQLAANQTRNTSCIPTTCESRCCILKDETYNSGMTMPLVARSGGKPNPDPFSHFNTHRREKFAEDAIGIGKATSVQLGTGVELLKCVIQKFANFHVGHLTYQHTKCLQNSTYSNLLIWKLLSQFSI